MIYSVVFPDLLGLVEVLVGTCCADSPDKCGPKCPSKDDAVGSICDRLTAERLDALGYTREPIAKLVSGDRLPRFGPFPSWNFGPWNHHAAHSIPKMGSKWDYRSSTQSFAIGSRVTHFAGGRKDWIAAGYSLE